MRVYFTGTDLAFVHRLREMVKIQNKEDEVIILPNGNLNNGTLYIYDKESTKLVEIKDIKRHSF